MELIYKVQANKGRFRKILESQKEGDRNHYTQNGRISLDGVIKNHLDSWCKSRIYGGSASMVLDNSLPEMIKLIDELASTIFIK